jgi:hypothetical protein
VSQTAISSTWMPGEVTIVRPGPLAYHAHVVTPPPHGVDGVTCLLIDVLWAGLCGGIFHVNLLDAIRHFLQLFSHPRTSERE